MHEPGKAVLTLVAATVLLVVPSIAAGPAAATEANPPRITSDPPVSALVGHEYRYLVAAEDDDGDALVFSLLQFPPGMVIDFQSGVVSWTPEPGQAGGHPVNLSVSDGTFREYQTFTVTVVNGTPPPPVVRVAYPKEGGPANRSLYLMGTVLAAPGAPAVERVEVRLDSGPWLPAELSVDGWSYFLDTSKSRNGPHRAYVRAYDGLSYSDTVELNLTYDNPRWVLLDYPLTSAPSPLPFAIVLVAILAAGPLLIIMWVRSRHPAPPR